MHELALVLGVHLVRRYIDDCTGPLLEALRRIYRAALVHEENGEPRDEECQSRQYALE